MYYQNFEELCKQRNIKPNKVSKETGVSTSTLTSWKQGKYTPKPDKLKLIADFFNVSLEFLMRNEDVQWNPTEQTMDYTISLSEEEQEILTAYRSADEVQKEMIKRLLNYSNNIEKR